MSTGLFSDHEPDDLVICFFHSVFAEKPDAADRALDIFHDDPVAALEYVCEPVVLRP